VREIFIVHSLFLVIDINGWGRIHNYSINFITFEKSMKKFAIIYLYISVTVTLHVGEIKVIG